MKSNKQRPNAATPAGPRLFEPENRFATPKVSPLAADPFRLFFTAGWLVSLLGLGLWPLFFHGWLEVVPGRPHAHLMIQGFFAAFATGFLWTALPRMLEVSGPGKPWLAGGLGLIAGNTLLHLAGYHATAHLLFLGLIGVLAGFAIHRFPSRKDLPPPSFVLVAAGFAAGAAGTAMVAAGERGWVGGGAAAFGRLLLSETFLLLAVMGVAAFLAPRFLGAKSRQNFPESRRPSPAWKRKAGLAGGVAAAVLAGSVLQSTGFIRSGALLTGTAVTGWILWQVPLWRSPARRSWMADGLRLALVCCMAAPWMRVVFPEARLESAHVLLMGGFGLLTLIIGCRVTFGHSGFEHLFQQRLPALGVVTGLCLAALGLRLAGGFGFGPWVPMLSASVIVLLAAHLLWGWIVLPKLLRPRPDPVPLSS